VRGLAVGVGMGLSQVARGPLSLRLLGLPHGRDRYDPAGRKDSAVNAPGETVFITDSLCIVSTHSQQGWPGNVACRGMPPHNDGINVLFCDGHVKWFKNTRAGGNGSPRYSSERLGLWTIDPTD